MQISRRSLAAAVLVAMGAAPGGPAAAQAADDHLVLVPSGQLQRLYLARGADLGRVTGVILEPTQVSFRDNWVRDFNRTSTARLTDRRAEEIRREVSTGMDTIFATAFARGGFQLHKAPGPGVVRVHTYVVDLALTAPTVPTPSRTRTFTRTAGEAALVLEVRDPRTSALLARGLDRRIAGQTQLALRNRVTNRSDFRRVFELWARSAVEDLQALQAASRSGTAR